MRRAQAGFTMIEVMVALLLTAVAVMGLLGVFIAVLRASSYSRHASEAAVLAQDKLEQLRLQSAATATGTNTGINERGVTPGVFTRTWTMTAGTTYSDIVVTVIWSEDGVAKQSVLRGRRNP
jgi:prepilin-type N-terminal cleavage/methylation domain-containing protein